MPLKLWYFFLSARSWVLQSTKVKAPVTDGLDPAGVNIPQTKISETLPHQTSSEPSHKSRINPCPANEDGTVAFIPEAQCISTRPLKPTSVCDKLAPQKDTGRRQILAFRLPEDSLVKVSKNVQVA